MQPTGDEDRPVTGGDEVLATVRASGPRRALGVGALVVLGGLMLAMALGTPMAAPWRLVFVALGLAALWAARAMYRATAAVLELTRSELRERGGPVLARVAEIERVDRSMFAMKPSNGFLLTLARPGARAWRPGLWWRIGRRVAIGGVTPASQTRPMADILAALKAGQV